MVIRLDRLRLRANRWLRSSRRFAAVGLLVAAALLATAAPRSATPPVVDLRPVLIATKALSPGHVLTADDITLTSWPDRLLPPNALGPRDDPVGRVLAAAVQPGEPLNGLRLLGPSLVDSLGPGLRAVPVRLTDAGVSALLHPGDRIDLYAVDVSSGPGAATSGELVVSAALVLGRPLATDGVVPEGAIVVVAVPIDRVAGLVAAAYTRSLAATLAPP